MPTTRSDEEDDDGNIYNLEARRTYVERKTAPNKRRTHAVLPGLSEKQDGKVSAPAPRNYNVRSSPVDQLSLPFLPRPSSRARVDDLSGRKVEGPSTTRKGSP